MVDGSVESWVKESTVYKSRENTLEGKGMTLRIWSGAPLLMPNQLETKMEEESFKPYKTPLLEGSTEVNNYNYI